MPVEPIPPPGPGGLVRVRLDLAYDGTGYQGWAVQAGLRTVQGVLQDALAVLLRGPAPRVTVAGRTDAGVHARGQVAHVDLPDYVAADPLLLRRLNGLAPVDLRVLTASAAPPGFDARFSALSRTYRYRVADGAHRADPLRRHDVLHVARGELDLPAMSAAGAPLLGLHDFAAFCRRREGATTIRTLLALSWRRDPQGLAELTITADAFCHSMVRALVGAMLQVGQGAHPPEWLAAQLLGAGRAPAPVAPPHGLVLEGVAYPPDHAVLERQLRTRRVRTRPEPGQPVTSHLPVDS